MKREKYTFNGDFKLAIKEIEDMLKSCLEHKNTDIKVISNKSEKDKAVYYPACRFAGNDDFASDVTLTVRKVNNSKTSIQIEDSEKSGMKDWRYMAMKSCYKTCKNVTAQICSQKEQV